MKDIKFKNKLSFTKKTIANLNGNEMNTLLAGGLPTDWCITGRLACPESEIKCPVPETDMLTQCINC